MALRIILGSILSSYKSLFLAGWVSRDTFISADVFDFLYERIMHQIKTTINSIKQSTPTTIPAISHPVRGRKEK